LRVIDLSGDFRLQRAETYAEHYGQPHTASGWLPEFVYGLTEIEPGVPEAKRIANPGCFATAILLGLAPLIAAHAIGPAVVANAITGSSGSGAKPATNTHHPKRANSFYAYKPFEHQHRPEILEALGRIDPEWPAGLIMQVHSAPLVRGIFASLYVELFQETGNEELGDYFRDYYARAPFVRLVKGSPDVNWVKNTNFADLGWAARGKNGIIFVAIDNLVKGAAGQAVQNMNLMFGLDETQGLMFPGSHP
ncbi:MAG: N-acetyl-gamma-glutamyl-phosphate reductase, partial [Acidobacteria bacterium]|nr:N-acetyl-gamma-glutamyl-phosphate reductase [Acidobacteriota bacterium]